MMVLDKDQIEGALQLLGSLMELEDAPPCSLVICGGAALRVTGLHTRTTKDVDVLALRDPDSGRLISPAPLPATLLKAARMVAKELALPGEWLNNEPSSDECGLFPMGLPEGLEERLTSRKFGNSLTASFISRIDQIHLKLYAAIDQPASYHTTDLQHLKPADDEIERAARWAMTHDVSEGFRILTRDFLRTIGFADVAARL